MSAWNSSRIGAAVELAMKTIVSLAAFIAQRLCPEREESALDQSPISETAPSRET